MDPLTLLILLICVTLGGLLVGVGVHFVPVGGAPAAMAQATGIGTGTTMLAFASGALGLISAGFTVHDMSASNGALHSAYPGFATAIANQTLFTTSGISDNLMAIILVMAAGIVGAMLMMVILAVMANVIYAFAIAVPLVSAKVKFDPITGDRQDIYVTKGTEGHGTPTVAVISSLLGGLFGGLGGALLYLALIGSGFSVPTAAFAAIGIFLVNSVLASYNITGTIEGFHDPKFKRIPRAIIACAVASFVLGIWAIAIIYLGA